MAYHASFISSVLAGFEDTIAALNAGTDSPTWRAQLDALDVQIRSLRVSLEPADNEPEQGPLADQRR